MTSTRPLVLAAGLVGLCILAVAILAHRASLTAPGPERAALRGARAAVHAELERLESVVPVGRTRDDGRWRIRLMPLLHRCLSASGQTPGAADAATG
jgi:hypothetical protein